MPNRRSHPGTSKVRILIKSTSEEKLWGSVYRLFLWKHLENYKALHKCHYYKSIHMNLYWPIIYLEWYSINLCLFSTNKIITIQHTVYKSYLRESKNLFDHAMLSKKNLKLIIKEKQQTEWNMSGKVKKHKLNEY